MIRNYGCQGGNTETAYLYISAAGGLTRSSDYPYTSFYGTTGTCDTSKTNYVVTVDGYYAVEGEEDMKNYVLSTGPLSICLDASDWATYESGVVSSCGTDIDHCVQVVGVNTDEGYWIIRNSWGTSWGESGYIRLQTDHDMCGITTDPTYTAPYLVSTSTTVTTSR
jgi:C1A family cysteine protease